MESDSHTLYMRSYLFLLWVIFKNIWECSYNFPIIEIVLTPLSINYSGCAVSWYNISLYLLQLIF